MIKVDIFSGFLGAGKTTLIKKLLSDGYQGEKLVLIENEFGDVGIDGGFMQEAGITVNEMNSGCICCSLTGDFREALRMVAQQYNPERILIEPSGVGKLSDIVAAVQSAELPELTINGLATVVDASKARVYMKNFGEFFNNQVQAANCIILSRTGSMEDAKIAQAEALLREKNPEAVIITTPWENITGRQILDAVEKRNGLSEELARMMAEGDEEEEECCCCHHHDEEDEHEHHHHHHDDDAAHEHHHHHDEREHHHHHAEDAEHEHHHGEHEHHHHHHHGHDADEVFQSWGAETGKKFTVAEISAALDQLAHEERFGIIIRAKGYLPGSDGGWIHFDYTPGEKNLREGPANVTGRLCVIGAGLKEDAVKELFGL